MRENEIKIIERAARMFNLEVDIFDDQVDVYWDDSQFFDDIHFDGSFSCRGIKSLVRELHDSEDEFNVESQARTYYKWFQSNGVDYISKDDVLRACQEYDDALKGFCQELEVYCNQM